MQCLKDTDYKKTHTSICGGTDGDELNPLQESFITAVLTQNAEVFLLLESHKAETSLRNPWIEQLCHWMEVWILGVFGWVIFWGLLALIFFTVSDIANEELLYLLHLTLFLINL